MTVTEPPMTMPQVASLLLDLGQCLCNELETTGAGPLCWCGIWPGEDVSWDYCGECDNETCGMAWVRLVNTFPYDTFPAPTLEPTCNHPLAYYVEVGAIRCMPTADEDGNLPPPDVIADAALGMYLDMEAMYRALICCNAPQISVENFQAQGPAGGCVGGTWLAYVSID